MSKRRSAGTLGDVTGGELLRKLASDMKAAASPQCERREPRALPESVDDELLRAFSQRQHAPLPSPPEITIRRNMDQVRQDVSTSKRTERGAYDGASSQPARSFARVANLAGQNASRPKKEIIKIARERARAIIEAADANAGRPTGARVPPIPENDMGAAPFRKIMAMRAALEGFAASHGAGSPGPETRALIARRIALGASKARDVVDSRDGHFVGHDFGTSTTKAVLRFPDNPSAQPFAVTVPIDWASYKQPHLWPTALWYDQTSDRFSAVAEESWRCLQGFKAGLIDGLGHRNCCGASPPVIMAEAAAAFLALHVAYVIGAALERDPQLKIAGINFGVPVAALGDAIARGIFDKIARVGLALVPSASDLRRSDVHSAWLTNPEPIMPFATHAELSGAIAGYCKAPRHYLGGHMIIDCGSATLDMASFTLARTDWPIGIYSARVEALGADSCRTYGLNGATTEECRKASRYQEYEVFREAVRLGTSGFAQDERRKYPYQVILIGGGIHSGVHGPLFERMQEAFHRAFHRPEIDPNLDFDRSVEPGRLVLADGLARDPIDLREVAMPRDRGPSPPSGFGLPYSDGYIGPEQT